MGAKRQGVKIIADGGITKSGDIVKALTIADAVILGGLLAGCREAPGEIMEISGKLYKQYRGMGSHAAMKAGSAARYGHDKNDTVRKVAAEGIEALKEIVRQSTASVIMTSSGVLSRSPSSSTAIMWLSRSSAGRLRRSSTIAMT